MSLDRVLFVPDTHVPFHDRQAWDLVLDIGQDFKPDTLVHLGDLMDFYAVSSYSKDPTRALRLADELVEVRECRADLDALGAKRKIMLGSNHGDRLERYLRDKAPALFGLITEAELLELPQNDWEWYPYRTHTTLGNLHLTHDVGGSGKYATARALDTFQASVVIGHNHAMQYFVGGDATGAIQVGAQFGWLGDVNQVDYAHRIKALRNWHLGFGIGYHDTDTGEVWLVPVPIIDYTACVEGRIYHG